MKIKGLDELSTLVSLCKRRGFIFQSSEIYGGLNSCWDYGPLGAQLKLQVKLAWWKAMTSQKNIVGLDAAIFMHPKVWEASGHVEGFTDPLVDCKACKTRFRADQSIVDGNVVCPSCQSDDLTEERAFNLMFQTQMGPVKDEGSAVYLRPETAQGIFVNFENVQTSMRKKLPFGIAQIGKSFRNEITPGNFIFRTREFEQMEMQFFVTPGEDEAWFDIWKEKRWAFYKTLGFNEENIKWHEHGEKELAHYAKQAYDVTYKFPFGWEELEGVHNRSDFDLSQHQKMSGKKLEYFDPQTQKKFLPYVIETAVGCDRLTLAILCQAYREETRTTEKGEDTRVVMGFLPKLAPYQVAILPLSKKEPLLTECDKIFENLTQASSHGTQDLRVDFDITGSIGKRYRRQDEIGTPLCVTYDFDSIEDKKVTVRHRDTMVQERISIENLKTYITDSFSQDAQWGL